MRGRGKLLFRAAIISLAVFSALSFSCACSEEKEPEEPIHFDYGGEELGTSPLTPPTLTTKSACGMVSYTYTARDSSVMRLSSTPSFATGITVAATSGVSVYSEVVFASDTVTPTRCPYRYAKSYYRDSDDVLWSSDTTYLYREECALEHSSAEYISDELLTSYKAFRMDAAEGDEVMISAAYKGECATYIDEENINASHVVASGVTVSSKLGEEISIAVGGITFYFRLRVGTIQMRADKRITLSDKVNSNTDYGAVVLAVYRHEN